MQRMLPACKEVSIESNDSDVVVLLLFYLKDFKALSLERPWIDHGKGKKAGYLLLHHMLDSLGA